MTQHQLTEAKQLEEAIDKFKYKLNTVDKMIEELNNGELVLEFKVYYNGLVHSHRYETKNKEFDYILGKIKAEYEKNLSELEEKFKVL